MVGVVHPLHLPQPPQSDDALRHPARYPAHKVYSAATYQWRNRFPLIADLLYEGSRWNANDGGRVLRAPSYAAVGLGGSVNRFHSAEAQTGIGNLFDRNYLLVQGCPETGRNLYINFRYRF